MKCIRRAKSAVHHGQRHINARIVIVEIIPMIFFGRQHRAFNSSLTVKYSSSTMESQWVHHSHQSSPISSWHTWKLHCEWHRYVDDAFVLLEPDTNIDDLPNVLNEFQPSIKFTHKPEKDNTIAFIDVRVIRTLVKNKPEPIDQDERQAQTFVFNTTIHRKETFTGLMTNWHSFVPFSYKKSSVVSMIQRALSICSTYSLLDKELLKI